jgi:PAS domain S-box-containing protein
MGDKPTYEELEQRVKELEKAVVRHKLVEETLQKSKARLQNVLSASPAVIYVCEPVGNYAATYVSRNIKEQLGYEPHEFLEDPNFWADHIHPEDRQRVLEELPHVFGHDHHTYEYRFQHKLGMYKWMRGELRVTRDKQGKPLELVGYQVDITERRRMEEVLRESEERFHQMAELSPFPVSIIDSDGRYLYLNNKFTEVFGYTLEDIPSGKDWFQKAYPDSEYRRKVLSAWESDLKKFRRHEVRPREFRVTCKDGTVRDIIFRPVTTENGKQFVTYEDLTDLRRAEMELRKHRDGLELLVAKRTVEVNMVNQQLRHEIKERKQAEEAVREYVDSYRTLAENLPGIVYRVLIRQNNRMHFFNNMLGAMTGYNIEELNGGEVCSIEPLIIPEDRVDIVATVKNAIKEDKLFEVEYRVRHKDGEIRYFSERGRPMRGTDGKPLYIDGVILDVTERRRSEQILQARKEELKARARSLNEANTALKVLLKHREEDKAELEGKVLSNVKELVMPYVESLRNSRLGATQMAYVNILKSNLTEIVSPFLQKLSLKYLRLTPREIQITGLIRLGKTTKEIARLLNVSPRAVEFHRGNMRRKLGLKNKKTNLRSYLLSIQ